MRCSSCGHVDNRPGIVCCSRCGSPLDQSVEQLPGNTPPSNQLIVPSESQQTAIDVRRDFDVSGFSTNIQKVLWERYRAEEALNQGNPLWEPFLKHVAAYKAKKKAEEYIPLRDELQKEAFIRLQRQGIDGELAHRQAEQTDAILYEQLLRRGGMLAEVMNQIERLFSAGQLDSLPDEIKAEMISRFFQQAEQMIFSNVTPTAHNAAPQALNNGITVIDADEF